MFLHQITLHWPIVAFGEHQINKKFNIALPPTDDSKLTKTFKQTKYFQIFYLSKAP